MRKTLSCAAMAAIVMLAWSADGAVAPRKATPATKSAAKKQAPHNGASTATNGTGTKSSGKLATSVKKASLRGRKDPVKRSSITWRNRQSSPSADRYREIQGALAAKGFLQPDEATGTWNQTSAAALKKFQAEQNLESSGKINSLSLIALGLGPHRDPAASMPGKAPPPGADQ